MSVNQLFDRVAEMRESANWQAAFGEPHEIEGKTVIPVARAGYAFGVGFGQGAMPAEEGEEPAGSGEGGGSGGAMTSKPLGAIVVTADDVRFEPVEDESKIAIAGMALVAVSIWQVSKTLREIFGR
jgi:uncharacterized spore protein YtfJ